MTGDDLGFARNLFRAEREVQQAIADHETKIKALRKTLKAIQDVIKFRGFNPETKDAQP